MTRLSGIGFSVGECKSEQLQIENSPLQIGFDSIFNLQWRIFNLQCLLSSLCLCVSVVHSPRNNTRCTPSVDSKISRYGSCASRSGIARTTMSADLPGVR